MGSGQELDLDVKFEAPVKHQNGTMRNDSWICVSEVQERGLSWRNIYGSHQVT